DVVLARDLGDAFAQVTGSPEVLLHLLVLLAHAALIPQLGEDDEPRSKGHGDQDEQGAFDDGITLFPEPHDAKRVLDGFGIGSHETRSSAVTLSCDLS